jgi:PII-like signaling protein
MPDSPKARDWNKAVMLRIYVGESDKHDGMPLYEAIVLKAREFHLAGATVLRSPMGFGATSHLHTSKILRLSADLPFLIEIVDTAAHLEPFIPELISMVQGGLITREPIEVLHYDSAPP